MISCTARKMRPAAIWAAAFAALVGAAFAVEPAGGTAKKSTQHKLNVDNPVRKVSSMMKHAGKLMKEFKGAARTAADQEKALREQKRVLAEQNRIRKEQQDILKELDRLIKLAQQSTSSSSSSKREEDPKPGDPKKAPKPQNSGGAGSTPMPDERDVFRAVKPRLGSGPPDLRKMWGKLKDAPRGDILQLLSEKLPMRYKRLLYRYFKALSELE